MENRGDYLDPSHADSNENVAGTLFEPAVIAERSLLTEEPAKLSLGGAYGRERTDFPENPSEDGLYDADFLMATAFLPLCRRLVVSGAAYGGENVDTFFLGGIAEGVNPVRGVPIRSLGGWLEGTVRVTPRIQGVAESNFFAKEKIGDDTNIHVRLQLSLYIYF